jgi:hypothetical protein
MSKSRLWHIVWVPAISAFLMWLELPSRIGIEPSRSQRLAIALLGGITFGLLFYWLDRLMPRLFSFIARRQKQPLPNDEP